MTTIAAPLRRTSHFVGLFLGGTILAVAARAQTNYTTPYYFSTFAGVNSIGSADGPGADARFFAPGGIAVDSSGNVYVSDSRNNTIRKITPDGMVSTLAGMAGIEDSTDGPGSVARFDYPHGIGMDSTGNLYIGDFANNTVRKVAPDGTVSTLAGTAGSLIVGPYGYISPNYRIDGVGSSARFVYPEKIALDAAGNIYVSDGALEYGGTNGYHRVVRKITPAGAVSTTLSDYLDYHDYSGALATDASNDLFVFGKIDDSSLTGILNKLTPSGAWTDETLALTTNAGISSMIIDPTGNLIGAEGPQIVKFDLNNGTANPRPSSILAGTTEPGFADGPASVASFNGHLGVARDHSGNTYVADADNNNIRKITPDGAVSTLAGLAALAASGSTDGTGAGARFVAPAGLCSDHVGNLYVADTTSYCVRKITPAGGVTTLAGTPGTSGSADGTGSIALFDNPNGIGADGTGNVFVADTSNCTIRKITPAGETTTLAGAADQAGHDDGPASGARFFLPMGIAVDPAGNVFVADTGNFTVRKISSSGEVSTLAGAPMQNAYVDGTGSNARFLAPAGLTIDRSGNLFVTDRNAIRKVTSAGVVTTIAGIADTAGSVDGTGSSARFNQPWGISVDSAGVLFVTDLYAIRKITPAGVVSTIAGTSGWTNTDGVGSQAIFHSLFGIALDANGNLYVANDTAIRKGQLAGAPVISVQPQNQTVATGSSAQFSVTVAAVPSPTYQWYFNGTVFNGAAGSTLSFANARSADAGDYTVVITNDLGSVTSAKATLTVTDGATSGSGSPSAGGGSFEAWFALLLLALGAVRGVIDRGFSRR
jgi:sugar lactone lactonase YvrE